MRRAQLLACLALGVAACQGEPAAPHLEAVDPSVVSSLVATPVLLRGRDFYQRATVRLDDTRVVTLEGHFRASIGGLDVSPVAYLDRATLGLTVPAGLAPGVYDVTVVAPSGASSTLPQGLTVADARPDLLVADALPDGPAPLDAGVADLSPDAAAPPDATAPPDISGALDAVALPDALAGVDAAGGDALPPLDLTTDVPPQCSNGVLDGSETGIDCGVTCALLCPGDPCPGAFACSTGVCDVASGRCVLASAPPSWLPAAPLPTGRYGLGVAVGADDLLYAMGGSTTNANQYVATVETYDPMADQWATVSAGLPTARGALTGARGSDGRVYALGGFQGGSKYLNTVNAYAATSGWDSPPPATMPVASYYHASASSPASQRFFVLGGFNVTDKYLAAVQIYAPSSGLWTLGAPMPSARFSLAAAPGPDGRIYALGGYSMGGGYHTRVEAYSPTLDQWDTTTAPLATARYGPSAALAPDGRIYAIGSAPPMLLGTVEAYDATTNSWTSAVASLQTPRGYAAAAVGAGGRLYLIGGTSSASGLRDVEAYGPRVTLSSASATPGAMVTVTGDNFAAGAVVVVLFGLSSSPVAIGASDGLGQIATPIAFTVPAVAAGVYPVRVFDKRSLYPVSAPLVVP